MARNCVICPLVERPDGEKVDSKLFLGLLSANNNIRKIAAKHYKIAANPEFKEAILGDPRAKYDENGELTVKSYMELRHLDSNDEAILKILNKQILSDELMLFDEGIKKMSSFNRSHPLHDDYLCTFVAKEDGQIQLSIVKRTPQNEKILQQAILKRSLLDRVKVAINAAGGNVRFIDTLYADKEESTGKYDTRNAEEVADGIYNVIEVFHGKNEEAVVYEEAGHFAVGALGDTNPLVERLSNAITPEIISNILGNEYAFIPAKDRKREVMGRLVGMSISKDLDSQLPIARLADRIFSQAKRLFYKITGKDIKADLIKARLDADKIAEGFLSLDQKYQVELALAHKENLNHVCPSISMEYYAKVHSEMLQLIAKLRSIDLKAAADLKKIYYDIALGRLFVLPSRIANEAAQSGIIYSVSEILNLLLGLLDSITRIDRELREGEGKHATNLLNARKIQEMGTIIDSATAIYNSLISYRDDMLKNGGAFNTSYLNSIQEAALGSIEAPLFDGNDLQLLITGLGTLLTGPKEHPGGLLKAIIDLKKEYHITMLEDLLGAKAVKYVGRLLWGRKKAHSSGKLYAFTHVTDDKIVTIRELVSSLDADISALDFQCGSLDHSSDTISSIYDMIVKNTNIHARKSILANYHKLLALEAEFESIEGLNRRDKKVLYELDEKGIPTGYIMSEYNFYLWELNLELKKQELEEGFANWVRNKTGEEVDSLSTIDRSIFHTKYLQHYLYQWHLDNSTMIVNEDGYTTYLPKILNEDGSKTMYYNEAWNTFGGKHNKEYKIWINKYIAFKKELDRNLKGLATNPYKLPQFRGTSINRAANRLKSNLGALEKATGASKVLIHELVEGITMDMLDTDFGGEDMPGISLAEDEYGIYDASYDDTLLLIKDMKRLPIYGVKTLGHRENGKWVKDTADLSTDLMNSTMLYIIMSCNYEAFSVIKDSLNIGLDALNERTLKGVKESAKDKNSKSRAYRALYEYIDRNVYRKFDDKLLFGRIRLRKLNSKLAALGSWYYLNYSLPGGIANANMGLCELLRTSLIGKVCNVGSFVKALCKLIGSYILDIFSHTGMCSVSKTTLYLQKMDADNRFTEELKSWSPGLGAGSVASKVWDLFSSILPFLPYSSTEKLMLGLVFLMTAYDTKVYDSVLKKQISLYDAYEKVPVRRSIRLKDGTYKEVDVKYYGRTVYDLRLKEGILSSKDVVQEYNTVLHIMKAYNDFNLALENLKLQEVKKPTSTTNVFNSVNLNDYITDDYKDFLSNLGITDFTDVKTILEELHNYLLKLTVSEDPKNDVQAKYEMNCKMLNNDMHGVYSSIDKSKFASSLYGVLLTGLRNYVFGMARRRYGGNTDTVIGGKIVKNLEYEIKGKNDLGGISVVEDVYELDNNEGYTNTSVKLMVHSLEKGILDAYKNIDKYWKESPFSIKALIGSTKVLGNLVKGVTSPLYYTAFAFIGPRNKERFKNIGLSESLVFNLRANSLDYISLIVLNQIFVYLGGASMLPGMFLLPWWPDDEEEREKRRRATSKSTFRGLSYYFVGRLLMEHLGFSIAAPMVAINEAKNWANIIEFAGLSAATDIALMLLRICIANEDPELDLLGQPIKYSRKQEKQKYTEVPGYFYGDTSEWPGAEYLWDNTYQDIKEDRLLYRYNKGTITANKRLNPIYKNMWVLNNPVEAFDSRLFQRLTKGK